MKKSAYSVAVIGATGLVGAEIIAALERRQFPLADLQPYASLRTAGDHLRCGSVTARVEPLDGARFDQTDIVFFAANEQVSAEWTSRATAEGAVGIDLSDLLVVDPDVPVVVPEVNPAAVAAYVDRSLVVSPDPVAIALAVALKPLHDAAPIARVVCSTVEPVSGAGPRGIEELQRQTIELINGQSIENDVFGHRIAFNVLPQVGEFLAGGWSRGELQARGAFQRVLDDPDLAVSITRTRGPLFYGTALCVNLETSTALSATEVRDLLRSAPGVLLSDDGDAESYSTLAEVVGQEAIMVSRIRADESRQILDLWIVIDTLRKGAAVNAVQIAELLIRDHL